MPTLDLEAVQAFVLVADLKSFTRAAEAMDTTQSAVSLKIKRLEQENREMRRANAILKSASGRPNWLENICKSSFALG